MTKDKKKYIENLFYNYKKNIARKKILELGLVTDDDYTLGAIDYSADKIQTSNISSLDNRVIARENELEQLTDDVAVTEILLDSLNEKDITLITKFYIEKYTAIKVGAELGYYSETSFHRNKNRIISELMRLI